MDKKKIKEIIIAALVGALITFLSQILQGIIDYRTTGEHVAMGGGLSAIFYAARAWHN